MFWMRNKENSFPIRTLIWRPGWSQLGSKLFAKIIKQMTKVDANKERVKSVTPFENLIVCFIIHFLQYKKAQLAAGISRLQALDPEPHI